MAYEFSPFRGSPEEIAALEAQLPPEQQAQLAAKRKAFYDQQAQKQAKQDVTKEDVGPYAGGGLYGYAKSNAIDQTGVEKQAAQAAYIKSQGGRAMGGLGSPSESANEYNARVLKEMGSSSKETPVVSPSPAPSPSTQRRIIDSEFAARQAEEEALNTRIQNYRAAPLPDKTPRNPWVPANTPPLTTPTGHPIISSKEHLNTLRNQFNNMTSEELRAYSEAHISPAIREKYNLSMQPKPQPIAPMLSPREMYAQDYETRKQRSMAGITTTEKLNEELA